ncbi:MAG: molybdopterin converting factor subunit 1 [Alphaproteobacteria bacterium]|uniref:Molybdopterin converting factor subunit 1 n=1 Tax=PS1 clade bacterium TaxID=2175152 RepID=A0A368DQF0_9PROT|nr:molybdopterin converting factor subunit 1 [Rhodobiaceae bacterium]OUT75337.1 MAG: molybdopterin converting factor subunit 1 [Rhizobiales bacterium TMED25]RCL73874.1 MAG: molybdopterin converting factor subunit 1 [PS1 clade bacterium]|tara:strand:- start:24918 stop:25169 length:252 start_codon:yes stop_codon:yes gene_type:complete
MKLKYFAWIAEIIGKREEIIELPEKVKTINDLIYWLSLEDNSYKIAFEDTNKLKYAINQILSQQNDKITNNDEIAFFPPMTGG